MDNRGIKSVGGSIPNDPPKYATCAKVSKAGTEERRAEVVKRFRDALQHIKLRLEEQLRVTEAYVTNFGALVGMLDAGNLHICADVCAAAQCLDELTAFTAATSSLVATIAGAVQGVNHGL